MSIYFLGCNSVGRLLIETPNQNFSGLRGNKTRILNYVRRITNCLRNDELICSPKIEFPKKHFVIHNTDRPNINSYGIRISWIKFWSHVRRCSDVAGESIFSGGKSEIPNLANSVFEKNIIGFNISVNDSSLMAII